MTETQCTVQVGQVVPDFELTTFDPTKGDFGKFSLAEARKAGKWTVLVFYPADFTFVCATEFKALADRYSQFQKLNCEVVTVSTDTHFTHLAWQREEKELAGVRYPMGADHTGKIARMFGVLLPDNGLALRGTFIISPDGKLVGAECNFLNLGRNMDELLRKVRANVFLKDSPQDVCPANWNAVGDKTLKPSAKMVGRVHDAMNG